MAAICILGVVAAGLCRDIAARGIVLEDEVHNAGDSVGAVLSSCAIKQHFDVINRTGRYHRYVGGGTAREAVDTGDVEISRAVAAFAVDHYQRVVRRKTAHCLLYTSP